MAQSKLESPAPGLKWTRVLGHGLGPFSLPTKRRSLRFSLNVSPSTLTFFFFSQRHRNHCCCERLCGSIELQWRRRRHLLPHNLASSHLPSPPLLLLHLHRLFFTVISTEPTSNSNQEPFQFAAPGPRIMVLSFSLYVELIVLIFYGYLSIHFWFFNIESIMYSFFISSCSVVTLLDYGAGNVRSVRNAIRFLGFDIKDVSFFFFFFLFCFY